MTICVACSGRAGVALSTLGPGATNFTTAAAYSHLGAFPAGVVALWMVHAHAEQTFRSSTFALWHACAG